MVNGKPKIILKNEFSTDFNYNNGNRLNSPVKRLRLGFNLNKSNYM